MNQAASLSPTGTSERIHSLDLLRGFAILGILMMNIQSFSMIEAAYMNPTAFGDFTGLNKIVWMFSHIFFDQKFMTIFSILFGAGIILFIERAKAGGKSAAALHYRRTLWLMLIGLVHAHIFWHGDILVPYAMCAVLVYLFHRLSPGKLFIIGGLLISVSSLLYIVFAWSIQFWPPEAIQNTMNSWKPEPSFYARELSLLKGNLLQQLTYRIPASIKFETFIFMIWTGWRAGGLMLIGMGLYKTGILSAKKEIEFYKKGFFVSFVIGLFLVVSGMLQNFANDFKMEYSMFIGGQFNYYGSLFLSFSYISLIMWLVKTDIKLPRVAAIGRMALTNYLLQTLICTTIFYGHGLALIGEVERKYQLLLVSSIWIFQLLISKIWLNYFKFGPAEWLWRSLTYLNLQPFRV